jgi:phosphate uptake regulator
MSETRKLQRIGKTLYVSIPKSWTNIMQLQQGDKVKLIPQRDDSLCICSANTKERPREIILRIKDITSMHSLKREIVAAYVDGFDIIKLKAEERIAEGQQESIREIVNHLFGLEIIEISGDAMTIQCLLKRTLEINKTIQRIYNVIATMFEETVFAVREQRANLIPGLSRRMQDIRRLSLVTNRLLRSFLLFPMPENHVRLSLIDCVDYLQILHIISEIACNVNKISESVMTLNKQDLPKQILEPLYQVSVTIKRSFNNSVQALLFKDINLANQILDNMPASDLNLEELWKFFREAEKSKMSSLVLSHAYLLIDCLKRINHHSAEIAEIAIDRAEAANANSQNIKTKKVSNQLR